MLTIPKTKATFSLSSTTKRKKQLFSFQCDRTRCKTTFWTAKMGMVVRRIFRVYKGNLPCRHCSWANHKLHPKLREKTIERKHPKDNPWHSHSPLADAILCVMVPVWCCCHTKVLLEASVACVLQISLMSVLAGKYLSETCSKVTLLKGHCISWVDGHKGNDYLPQTFFFEIDFHAYIPKAKVNVVYNSKYGGRQS